MSVSMIVRKRVRIIGVSLVGLYWFGESFHVDCVGFVDLLFNVDESSMYLSELLFGCVVFCVLNEFFGFVNCWM